MANLRTAYKKDMQIKCEELLKKYKKLLKLNKWKIKIKALFVSEAEKIKDLNCASGGRLADFFGHSIVQYKSKIADIYIYIENVEDKKCLKDTVLHELLHIMVARLTHQLENTDKNADLEEVLVTELTTAFMTKGIL